MRLVASVVTVALVVSVGHGLLSGDLAAEGRTILDLAWGRVSLADIYTGVFVLGSWIVWRERSLLKASPWLALLVVLGNFGIAFYLWWVARDASDVRTALVGSEV